MGETETGTVDILSSHCGFSRCMLCPCQMMTRGLPASELLQSLFIYAELSETLNFLGNEIHIGKQRISKNAVLIAC